jgi:hypothetical protein
MNHICSLPRIVSHYALLAHIKQTKTYSSAMRQVSYRVRVRPIQFLKVHGVIAGEHVGFKESMRLVAY